MNHIGKSNIGILIIHGFTSTPQSMEHLFKAYKEKKYHIEMPLLPGHGTNWEELNNTKYKEWLTALEKSLILLKKRSNKIFITGLSLGGALTLRLAELHPEITGIIPINNALIFKDFRLFFVPIIKHIIPALPAIGGDIKDPSAIEICYDKNPLKAVDEVKELCDLTKKELYKIKQPTLIFKSKEDHVIPIISATYTYEHISSEIKELYWLENSYHVATLDYDKALIVKKSLEFIEKIV